MKITETGQVVTRRNPEEGHLEFLEFSPCPELLPGRAGFWWASARDATLLRGPAEGPLGEARYHTPRAFLSRVTIEIDTGETHE